jgi:hypothetical protein
VEADFAQRGVSGVNGETLAGYYRAHFGGYWSGGDIRRNTPAGSLATFGDSALSTDPNVNYFNPEAVQNQSADFSIAGDDTFTIGAFFPRGYPRWVRYSQTAQVPDDDNRLRKSGRLPRGPRGLLWVVNSSACINGIILPAAPPAVLGETEDAWGHAVVEGCSNGATALYPAIGSERQLVFTPYQVTPAVGAVPTSKSFVCGGLNLPASVVTTNAGGTSTSIDWDLAGVYPIPPYAKAILVELNVLFTMANPTDEIVPAGMVGWFGSPGSAHPGFTCEMQAASKLSDVSPDSYGYRGVFRVPLPRGTGAWDSASSALGVNLAASFGHTTAPTGVTGFLQVVGYEL